MFEYIVISAAFLILNVISLRALLRIEKILIECAAAIIYPHRSGEKKETAA